MKRKEAKEAGLFKYFTGTPCKRGHNTYRYAKTGNCAACNVLNAAAYREAVKQNLKSVRYRIDERDVKVLDTFVESLKLARSLDAP